MPTATASAPVHAIADQPTDLGPAAVLSKNPGIPTGEKQVERTIGVDLAVQPGTTAAEIRWNRDGAEAKLPRLGCTDEYLLDLLLGLASGERAGIDCPFGWPTAFVEAILCGRQ
jgi:hypothetical protein